jgi:hypothetical protein
MTDHLRGFDCFSSNPKFAEVADHQYTLYDQFTETYAPVTGLVCDYMHGDPIKPVPKNWPWIPIVV